MSDKIGLTDTGLPEALDLGLLSDEVSPEDLQVYSAGGRRPVVPAPAGPYARSAPSLTGEAAEILGEALGLESMYSLQSIACRLLEAGLTVSKVAQSIGVHTVTLMAWQSDPAFHAAMVEGSRRRSERLRHAMADGAEEAISAVRRILSGDAPHSTKLKAAELLLDRAEATSRSVLEAQTRSATQVGPLVEVSFSDRLAGVLARSAGVASPAVIDVPATPPDTAGPRQPPDTGHPPDTE